MVRYLLENGADSDLCNADGKSALDYATEMEEEELIALLEERSRHAVQRREEDIKAELKQMVDVK
jgi:ankyrin repeat protein